MACYIFAIRGAGAKQNTYPLLPLSWRGSANKKLYFDPHIKATNTEMNTEFNIHVGLSQAKELIVGIDTGAVSIDISIPASRSPWTTILSSLIGALITLSLSPPPRFVTGFVTNSMSVNSIQHTSVCRDKHTTRTRPSTNTSTTTEFSHSEITLSCDSSQSYCE